MGGQIQFSAIFIANGMALLLGAQLLLGNDWRRARSDREYRYLLRSLCVIMLACVVDPIVFLADGRPGIVPWLTVYIGNMLLFTVNIVIGMMWLMIVCRHLLGRIPRPQKALMIGLSAIGLAAIVVNLFVPVVFSVGPDSVYHREILFWLYTCIEGLLILDGVCIHIYAKRKGDIFKFFPVLQFVVPVLISVPVQAACYGISIIYPAVIISFAGMLNSLRNEALHRDSLTGLYNRLYLDHLGDGIRRKGPAFSVTALMLDVNGFKAINDRYGHAEGDDALLRTAAVLRDTVGALGCVVRYAGDEFVILLNTSQKELIEGCISAIHRGLREENERAGKEYPLSVSIGACSLGGQYRTLDDILSGADRRMYEQKQSYYRNGEHDRRRR